MPDKDPSAKKLEQRAKEEYNAAVEAAKELLKRPITVPAPPSISFQCLNDQQIAKANEYAELVTREEAEIVHRLISADKNVWILSSDHKSDFSWAIKLMERMNAKIEKLIQQYKPEPEKLLAVYHAAYKVWRAYDFLTGEAPHVSSFLDWTKYARKYYMDKLTKEHEYRAFGAALVLDRYCRALGGSSSFYEILNALKFKLTVETVLDIPGYLITVKGEGTLKAIDTNEQNEIIYNSYDERVFVQGIGTLGYRYDGEDEDLTILPEEFPVKMQVKNWNPCESNTINILIESFGSDDETHVYDLGGEKVSYNDPIVNDFAEGFFEKEITDAIFFGQDGSYIPVRMIDFEAYLRNGQATVAVETIDRKQPGTFARILVHFQLEHTPE